MEHETILDPPAVSEMTGVKVATLAWYRHIGEGPKSFKLGARKVAYRKSDVQAWLDAQYAAANPVAS